MTIFPSDWASILLPQTPIVEGIIRISIVYLFLFFLMRVVLRRESGGIGLTDILVIVLVADAVQSGMSGGAKSVGDALILATTLVFWDWFLSFLGFKNNFIRRLLRPKSLLVIKDGKIRWGNTRAELLTLEDIEEELRLKGIKSIKDVDEAYIESDGQFSVVVKEKENPGVYLLSGESGIDDL